MTEFLRSWILNITVIIIFVMVLDMIMPSNSMRRYINVVVGLLIIIAVIKPFVLVRDYAESFNSEFVEAASYLEEGNNSGKSIEISKYQQLKTVEIFEENLKKRLIGLVEESAAPDYEEAAVELVIEKDFEKEDFGNIKSIRVSLNGQKNKVIQVDKIKIGDHSDNAANKNVINKDKAEYNLNDNKISTEIKEGISKALGISESIVFVEVQH